MVSFPIFGLCDNDDQKLVIKCFREIAKIEFKKIGHSAVEEINK